MAITEITQKGNLPKCFQVMAKELHTGERSTMFYECSTPKELLDLAKNKECEELTCILDPTTERGYMAGFAFKDSDIAAMGGNAYVKMHVYFAELTGESFSRYNSMLDRHRKDQEDDMQTRRSKRTKKSKEV